MLSSPAPTAAAEAMATAEPTSAVEAVAAAEPCANDDSEALAAATGDQIVKRKRVKKVYNQQNRRSSRIAAKNAMFLAILCVCFSFIEL